MHFFAFFAIGSNFMVYKNQAAVSRITTVIFYTASNGQYSFYRLAGLYYLLGCEPIEKLVYLLRCFKDTSIFYLWPLTLVQGLCYFYIILDVPNPVLFIKIVFINSLTRLAILIFEKQITNKSPFLAPMNTISFYSSQSRQ